MSWARKLPGPARRLGGAVVHGASRWAADLGAVGPGDPLGRRFGAFGEGACLTWPQGSVYNERYIRVGAGTIVGPYVNLAVGMAPGQVMASDPVITIGARTLIGRGSHIIGHWSIEIGDDIQTGPYVYITDQNHSYRDPVEPVGRQWPVEAPVRIGSGCWLGANVVVLPGADIGEHVVVAAGAVVRGVVPHHSVVAGVPARVVRRWFPDRGWVDVPAAPVPPLDLAAGEVRTPGPGGP